MQKTSVQQWDTGRQNIAVQSMPPKKRFFSPLVLGAIGLFLLLALGGVSIGGAYMAGIIGNRRGTDPTPTPGATRSPGSTPIPIKAEMIQIPGGNFTMGRSDGGDAERPEHPETVKGFRMDKTEVTNAEYYQFIEKTGHKPGVPHVNHWVNEKPIAGQEGMPVRFVNIDDIKAFAQWRSERDGVTYRLPTEQEWEYAARNGAKGNLYPWGDKFEAKCAFLDQLTNETSAVGTKSCPNMWGVEDLIGNVYEWTSTDAWAYPGSAQEVRDLPEPHKMVRGGSAVSKSTGQLAVTSTFRVATPTTKRSVELGFRLVRSE